MGLIKAGVGAVGGVLADQWKEFFYCEAMPKELLVTKGQKRVSGRSSNTKGSDNIITNGSVIAVAGAPRRELLEKRCSQELEQLMELRRSYRYQDGDLPVRPTDASDRYRVGAAAPIVTEGDLMGCVLLLSEDGAPALGEAEQRLVQTVAGFLGRQMES